METIEIAHKIVEVASEKQASDIVLLDMRDVCNFAEYFVICTGESDRQLVAISEGIQEALEKQGVKPLYSEGTPDSGWLLLDFGSIIAHIFTPGEREYYGLDKLWSKAQAVLRIQ